MIFNILYSVANGFARLVVSILPSDGFMGVSLSFLDSWSSFFVEQANRFTFMIPFKTIAFLAIVVLTFESAMIVFNAIRFLLNLIRGSGT